MPDERERPTYDGDDARWRLRILVAADDTALLQRFFEANPAFFLAVRGEPPASDEAAQEFVDLPPSEMPHGEMVLLGVFDRDDPSGALVGMATVVSDLIARHVGHLGLFIVATALHGSGAAHAIYAQVERWMVARGAHWMRLGVVIGNVRAERFWARCGFVQVRERGPVQMGLKSNRLRVMVKPLAGGTLDAYLAQVDRDRPDAAR